MRGSDHRFLIYEIIFTDRNLMNNIYTIKGNFVFSGNLHKSEKYE